MPLCFELGNVARYISRLYRLLGPTCQHLIRKKCVHAEVFSCSRLRVSNLAMLLDTSSIYTRSRVPHVILSLEESCVYDRFFSSLATLFRTKNVPDISI